MKKLYLLLAYACFGWAGYSGFRFLFLTTDYAGYQWILSIIIEIGLGIVFLGLSEDRH